MRSFLRHHRRSFDFSPVYKRLLSSKKASVQHASKHANNIRGDAANALPGNDRSRLTRLLDRSPKFLHPYVSALRTAPVSHITAFLLLHEITAVVPLFTLAGLFHYYNWLPPYFAEGEWVTAGVEKFGRYFKRKGWISEDAELSIEKRAENGQDLRVVEEDVKEAEGSYGTNSKKEPWKVGGGSMRLVVEFATAYTIVKALLIPRLLFSAWAAPGFARWTVVPLVGAFRSLGRNRGNKIEIAKKKDG